MYSRSALSYRPPFRYSQRRILIGSAHLSAPLPCAGVATYSEQISLVEEPQAPDVGNPNVADLQI